MKRRLADAGLSGRVATDSAGTHGYHVGHPPDHRAIAIATEYGVDISGLRARRVEASDFERFELILAMDSTNLEQLQARAGQGGRPRIRLMMEFASEAAGYTEVPDPYYGDTRDFRLMCDLLEDASDGLLKHVETRLAARADDGQAR